MADRIGSFIQLMPSGRKFYPLDPRPEEIDILDISYGLAGLYRFGGFTRYTVAQHCLEVSKRCTRENQLAGLLHDAAEGLGLGDMPTPIKRIEGMETYRWVETRILEMVFRKFGVVGGVPAEVHKMDAVLLATEARQFMAPLHVEWTFKEEPLAVKLHPLSPEDSRAAFLNRFYELWH